MQKKLYKIAGKNDSRKIAEFLSKEGQLLLPFLDLICNTEQAVDELIDIVGKGAIEAVLLLSAQQLAGPKQPGKVKGQTGWHGRQQGVVSLSQRKLRVEKPRLRKKGKGHGKEVAIPAYEAMVMNSRLGSTNVIESPNSGIRSRTRRVKDWQDHGMVVRWVAASLLDMEKRFKRTMGYQQLWMLEAKLKDLAEEERIDEKSKVA